MVGPASGATQQAQQPASQTPKSGKKGQQQAQTPPRATKNDVFDQQENVTEEEDDEGEEYEETDAGGEGNDVAGQAQSGVGGAKSQAEGAAQTAQDQGGAGGEDEEAVPIGSVQQDGSVAREDGDVIGSVATGDPKKLEGSIVDQTGDILDNEGNVVGTADPNAANAGEGAEGAEGAVGGAVDGAKDATEDAAGEAGEAGDAEGATGEAKDAGEAAEGAQDATEGAPDVAEGAEGAVEGAEDTAEGAEGAVEGAEDTAEGAKDTAEGAAEDALPKVGENIGVPLDELQFLKAEGPLSFKKNGEVIDAKGNNLGKLTEGDRRQLADDEIQTITEQGQLIGDDGTILGQMELTEGIADKLNEVFSELPGLGLSAPFEIGKHGNVSDSAGNKLGEVTEGDPKELAEQDIKDITEEGELIGKEGRVFGKMKFDNLGGLKEQLQRSSIPSPEILEGKEVNKAGKVVDEKGGVWGKVVEGDAKKMAGRKCDAEGKIWNDSGKVMGRAEALPESERELDEEAPFEAFPGAKVQKNGDVIYEGTKVGEIVQGDPKKMEGHEVDPDGDINDKHGNTLGHAERYDEPEPEPEPEVDNTLLAGKRVNKAGNLVDDKGSLFGRVVEGDVLKLVGKMADKDGNIWSENGQVIGRAELLPESERETKKEGPFANYQGCKVNKDGKVVSLQGEIIGRLTEGDAKNLAGHEVDPDGDVVDSQGNAIGKAERWEEEEPEKKHHPCAGYRVNSEGNVVDETGEIIGKLTSGKLEDCRGIDIDDDGDVSNQKNETIGHVTRIQDCNPEKTQEEIEAEERAAEEQRLAEEQAAEEAAEKEKDSKLAKRLSYTIEQYMEKVNPILKDITTRIENAEATPKEELDEEQLVKDVKPLIEEGGKILSDCNSEIRSYDPDGRIQTQAKMNASTGEGTPEEHRLAEQLKHMSQEVQGTIDNAKKKLAGMPHAKEALNPLWALLSEPLFQIIAAVGLLLSGVLGLVGKLLGGLGLDGIFGKLMGGLGVDKLVKGLTGKK
ncbi:MAG: hypothetical protein M1831_001274 [Alyxoria varia]|nr:MAG: hypothetical protein M1831_001274 [Alyxoria varia]